MEPEEAIYREGLSRNWALRHGQRPGSLSRMSAFADGGVLVASAIALALYWVKAASQQLLSAAIGAAILCLIISHVLNGHFRKLEKLAFADLEEEAAGKATRHRASDSPFYALAKLATRPRVRAKREWVEKRTETFLRRRAVKQRQAEIFEKQFLKIGSTHGTAGARREFATGDRSTASE